MVHLIVQLLKQLIKFERNSKKLNGCRYCKVHASSVCSFHSMKFPRRKVSRLGQVNRPPIVRFDIARFFFVRPGVRSFLNG